MNTNTIVCLQVSIIRFLIKRLLESVIFCLDVSTYSLLIPKNSITHIIFCCQVSHFQMFFSSLIICNMFCLKVFTCTASLSTVQSKMFFIRVSSYRFYVTSSMKNCPLLLEIAFSAVIVSWIQKLNRSERLLFFWAKVIKHLNNYFVCFSTNKEQLNSYFW